MQIKSFEYTKANGNTSFRNVIVISEPSNMVRGIDVSELDEHDQAALAIRMSEAYQAYLDAQAKLFAEFDVTRNFRQFDPLKMTNIESVYFGPSNEA